VPIFLKKTYTSKTLINQILSLNKMTPYTFPEVNPAEAMHWSLNSHINVMLRNLQGGQPELGSSLRRLAYRASQQARPMKVLELTQGLPFSVIHLTSPRSFRNNGDYLEYYAGSANLDNIRAYSTEYKTEIKGNFESPEIHATVISPRDYLLDFLSGDSHGFEDRWFIRQNMSSILYNLGHPYNHDSLEELSKGYQELKSSPRLTVVEGDTLQNLESLSQKGERYDLIFCNQLMYTPERVRTLQGLQSITSIGGIGYIPLTWWAPKSISEKKGVTESALIADTFGSNQPLEGYLASNHPEAYETAQFSGVKTLLIKGTQKPVQLPQMNGEITSARVSEINQDFTDMFPDMPVINWTLA
jgi:hypothetical protein